MADVIMVNGEAVDVPAILASKWGHAPAAGYVTGGWPVEWSELDFARFARKIRVDQAAADPRAAKVARALDVENGAATPDDVPAFLVARPRERYEQTTIYCNLATVPAVRHAVAAAVTGELAAVRPAGPLIPRWWLAWWQTGAGIPTRAQVLAELKRLTGADMDPDLLWACQYRSDQQWELSVVYGDPDFDR